MKSLHRDGLLKLLVNSYLENCLDSCECHMAHSVKKQLQHFKVELVLVPGGWTKYIEAPDVLQNEPYKASVTE